MSSPDVLRLLLLREVARHGSLTAAAAEAGYTTSAVSQQVAKLEREAAVPLLTRHPRGVWLTEAGQVLVDHATRIAETLEAAGADMRDFTELRRGLVTIGTFPTAGASLLPHVLVALRERHPDLRSRISSGRLDWLLQALRTHQVELALLWEYDWAPLDRTGLVTKAMLEDPTVALLPRSHRLAGHPTVDAAELADDDWIVRADHPVSEVLHRVAGAAGFTPRVVLASNDYPEVQGMVAAGLGVSLAPRMAVWNARPDVSVVTLAGNPAPRRILLGRLAERRPSPAATAAEAVFASVSTESGLGDVLVP